MVTGRSPRHLDPVGVKCGERTLCRKVRTVSQSPTTPRYGSGRGRAVRTKTSAKGAPGKCLAGDFSRTKLSLVLTLCAVFLQHSMRPPGQLPPPYPEDSWIKEEGKKKRKYNKITYSALPVVVTRVARGEARNRAAVFDLRVPISYWCWRCNFRKNFLPKNKRPAASLKISTIIQ